MSQRQQTVHIAFAIIGTIALIIIGISLNQIQLDPGLPFDDLWAFLVNEFTGGFVQSSTGYADVGIGQTIVDIVRIAYTIALICFPIAIFIVLSSKESRKRFLRTLLFVFLLIVLLSGYVLNTQIAESEDVLDSGPMIPPEQTPSTMVSSITDSFEPAIPRWIVWTLSTVIILLAIVTGIVIYRLIHPPQESFEPLPELADKAKSALIAMQQGADFRNTILQCYSDMLRIVREQRGIQRHSAVTATEFIISLVKLGLPEHAVTQLTNLFEEVRYGSRDHTPVEEQKAIHSLHIIADSIKVTT